MRRSSPILPSTTSPELSPMRTANSMPFLGVHAFGELHRVHDVGEQHRDLLALALERAASAEDLLGEMPRGVDVRPARRLGHRGHEPLATGIAEPLPRRADGRTAR